MLGWIEKVVPQPPVISSTPVIVEETAKPEAKESEYAQKPSEGNSSQPAGGAEQTETVVTPDPASTAESSGRGVLTWLSEGLGKVVPQPLQHGIIVQEGVKTVDAASQTEAEYLEDEVANNTAENSLVRSNMEHGTSQLLVSSNKKSEAADPSGVEGELQPSSDINAPEIPGVKTMFSRLLEEFEKMIPQPENVKKIEERTPEKHAADQGNAEGVPQEGSSPTTPLAKHHASADSHSVRSVSLFPQTLGGEGGSIFKRFIQGLGNVIPQPVSKEKPDEQTVESGGLDPGQERSKGA